MSVLVEPGHKTTYPLNHARIMWNSVITAATATGERANFPASAALTKTTYERWSPNNTGESITLTFPRQYINCIALAAHSNLTPTVEVRVFDEWQTITAYPPDGDTLSLNFAADDYGVLEYSPDNEAIMFLIEKRLADAVRITVEYDGASPTLGVVMAGTVLEMHRPLYGGHRPAMLTSDSKVQPNVSESGEWLGASLLRQGRPVNIPWDNLPAAWVRKYWQPFAQGLKTNPFVVAWNPLRASADAIYCSSSEQPSPSNSGTRDLQSVSLTARGYSDGTDPVVEPLVGKDLLDLVTFTRDSEATYYDAQGVLRTAAVDEPRLTYDPDTGEALGLLIEEERTNLLLWSEAFDNAAWNKTGAAVDPDVAAAPDGSVTADRFTTSVDAGGVDQSPVVSDGPIAFSCYAKKDSISIFRLRIDAGTDINGYFDLNNGTVFAGSAATASIKYVGGGWFYCEVSGSVTGFVKVQMLTFDGTAYQNGSVLIWGAQLEAGSFPTSYIKTEGSQVTRGADNASVDELAGWFNADEGTIYCEWVDNGASPTNQNPFGFNDGNTAGGNQAVWINKNSSGLYQLAAQNTFAIQSLSSTVPVSEGRHSVAVSYVNGGVYSFSVDGEPAIIGTETALTGFTQAILGSRNNQSAGSFLNAPVISLKFVPVALSATELQELTAP